MVPLEPSEELREEVYEVSGYVSTNPFPHTHICLTNGHWVLLLLCDDSCSTYNSHVEKLKTFFTFFLFAPHY